MKSEEIVFVINGMGIIFRPVYIIYVVDWERKFCTKNEAKLIK